MSGFDAFKKMFQGFPLAEGTASEKNRAESDFNTWFEALAKSCPAITGERMTLTRANMRAALRQAFKAGRGIK